MKIRTLIADDEPMLATSLRKQLQQAWPEIEIIAEVNDGTQALRIMEEQKPDLAFLDIRMPGMNGIDIAWHTAAKCKIVFVSAWRDHAADAFIQGAADYILKPVTSRRLAMTIRRLKEHFGAPAEPAFAATNGGSPAAETPATQTQHPWLCVKTSADTRVIQHKDILYMESSGNYVRIVSQDVSGTVRQKFHLLLGKMPPDTFIQIHRCIAVNALMIKSVHRINDGARLLLHGTENELRVSRQYMKHFFGSEMQ